MARSAMTGDEALIIDGLVFYGDGSAEALLAAKVAAVNLTVSHFEADFEDACDQVARWLNEARREDSPWRLVEEVADIARARDAGQVGLIMGWQNMRPIGDRLDRLALFHKLGLRIMQPTYNFRNFMGDGCLEPRDGGLSTLGRAAVGRMNALGIAIDLSHVGERTSLDVVAASERPVLITHANARAVSDMPRNKSDEVIAAVAASGGVIGASIFGAMCWDGNPDHPPCLDDFVRHLEHMVELVGIDRVGLGTDLPVVRSLDSVAHITAGTLARYPALIGDYVRAFGNAPDARYLQDCGSHAELPRLVAALEARGWRESDLRALLGGNLLRTLAEIWGP